MWLIEHIFSILDFSRGCCLVNKRRSRLCHVLCLLENLDVWLARCIVYSVWTMPVRDSRIDLTFSVILGSYVVPSQVVKISL